MSSALIDPVCGTPVPPDVTSSLTHDGTELRFCSEFCRREFLRRQFWRFSSAPAMRRNGNHPSHIVTIWVTCSRCHRHRGEAVSDVASRWMDSARGSCAIGRSTCIDHDARC